MLAETCKWSPDQQNTDLYMSLYKPVDVLKHTQAFMESETVHISCQSGYTPP